jgi:hypothetical protein
MDPDTHFLDLDYLPGALTPSVTLGEFSSSPMLDPVFPPFTSIYFPPLVAMSISTKDDSFLSLLVLIHRVMAWWIGSSAS